MILGSKVKIKILFLLEKGAAPCHHRGTFYPPPRGHPCPLKNFFIGPSESTLNVKTYIMKKTFY
jgi:hypothetical protein